MLLFSSTVIALNHFLFIVYLRSTTQALSIPLYGYYKKDVDIQDSLVGITLSTGRTSCPIVIIHDDVLPEPALGRMITKFQNHATRSPFKSPIPALYIILDLAPSSREYFLSAYNTTDPTEIILKFLHTLYRRAECYTFIIWIRDPKVLELSSTTTIHPGWRENDIVLLPSHHTTKLYKSLTSQKFWNDIPNIIGLKRKYDGSILASSEIRIYTVIPYYSQKRRRKSQELDVWLVNEGRFLLNRPLFFDKFSTFNGAPIIVGVYWKEPFLIWGDYENPYLDGLDWRLLGLCRKQLNFTFTIKHSNKFGRPHIANGTWSGLMGLLRSNKIDLGIGGVAMYSERMESFGFTKPYFTDSFSFISPLSRTASSSWNSLIFQYDVWLAALSTMIASSIALKVVADLEYNIYAKFNEPSIWSLQKIKETGNTGGANVPAKENLESVHFRKAVNVAGFLVTVLCQKPYKQSPKQLSVQFVFYGIILGNFIMGIVFSGCLIAYLFQFKHNPLADKLSDVLNSGLQVNIQHYDGYLDYFMETSTDPTISNIYKVGTLVEKASAENNDTVSVDDVVRGKSVHIDSASRLKFTGKYRYKGARGLKFHLGSENIIDHVDIGFPVRKNWPFAKKFDDIINRAVENGFVQYWMQRLMQGQFGWDEEAFKLFNNYLHQRDRRVKDIDPSLILAQRFIPLSTTHLNGVMYLYAFGITLGIVTFLVEIISSVLYKKWKFIWAACLAKNEKSSKLSTPKRKQSKENKEMQKKLGHSTSKKVKKQIYNELGELFKIKKIKQQAFNNESSYASILWSDFDHCHDKFSKIKLNI